MTHNWKPGDVALRTGSDGTTRISFFTRQCHSMYRPHWHHDDGNWDRADDPEEFCTYRPLLVIDPESYTDRMRLIWDLRAADLLDPSWDEGVMHQKLQAALRSLLESEPEEPTGLGAVVRAGDDSAWVRIPPQHNCNNWRRADAPETRDYWRSIPRPITVLSEGWQESTDD